MRWSAFFRTPFSVVAFASVMTTTISGCTGNVNSDAENHRGDTQSTYDVWDFEIVSAYEIAGKSYRVAVVNERHFAEPNYELFGNDGLDENTRRSIPVGTSKRVVLSDFKLRSVHDRQTIEVKRLQNSEGVVVNLTHVRSCPVTTSEREQTSIVGDSSKGIITIPKLKTETIREYSAPPCADASDRQFAIAPIAAQTPTPEMLEAVKKSTEQNAKEAYQKKLNERIDEIRRDFEKRARLVQFEGTNEIEKTLCPRLSGLMQAAGVTEIDFDHREASRIEGKGFTEIRYESSATLLPMKSKFDDGDLSNAARLIRSLKADSRGCISVELRSKDNGASSEDIGKIAKQLETIIYRHQNSVWYERAKKDIGEPK